MEQEMRLHLQRCADIFAAARGNSIATVGRLAAGDWRFFERLKDDEKSFTARKYDEVIGWFSANWPEEAEWPASIARPPQPEPVSP